MTERSHKQEFVGIEVTATKHKSGTPTFLAQQALYTVQIKSKGQEITLERIRKSDLRRLANHLWDALDW